MGRGISVGRHSGMEKWGRGICVWAWCMHGYLNNRSAAFWAWEWNATRANTLALSGPNLLKPLGGDRAGDRACLCGTSPGRDEQRPRLF
jgi:hypothetical protein